MKISNKLEDYILEHSNTEDELLQELRRKTHLKVRHPRMLSGPVQGKLLELLTRMINPGNVLEIGTYTGYSAICIARGLNEGSKLYTLEVNDELESFTRSFFDKSEVSDKINFIIGDARKSIDSITVKFDLIFIDGEKDQYCDYYKAVFDKLNPRGYILADNVLWSGKVIDEDLRNNDHFTKGIIAFNKMVAEDNKVENIILPLRDGINLIRKIS